MHFVSWSLQSRKNIRHVSAFIFSVSSCADIGNSDLHGEGRKKLKTKRKKLLGMIKVFNNIKWRGFRNRDFFALGVQ